jgi:hypothetical protein
MARMLGFAFVCTAVLASGCIDFSTKPVAEEKKPAKPENSGEGIFKKTTQEVGKFDPNAAHQVVSDHKINASDPVTGPLMAYGPILESSSILVIKHDIDLFEADTGHYPTYEEFMEKIIKQNNRELPVLPFKGKYMYDEAKHELVVVRDLENAAKAKGEE